MANEERSKTIAVFSSFRTTVQNILDLVRPSQERGFTDDSDIDPHNQFNECSPWDQLPPEILTIIFSYLDLSDKGNVEKTCRSWKLCFQTPSLWREMAFHFNSNVTSVDVCLNAYRFIESKGHHLRRLVITTGHPSMSCAWLMSRCVQILLDFISHCPSSQEIEHFSLTGLNMFQEWRFFERSRNQIYRALCDFLSKQKKLKSVDFTSIQLTASNGKRVLRVMKNTSCKYTVQRMNLHGFFRKSYRIVNSRTICYLLTSLFALRELGLDAKHLNDKTLRRLTGRSSSLQQLQLLKLYVDGNRDIDRNSFVSKQAWLGAREACPDLRVSVQITGWISRSSVESLLVATMPLSHCVISWSPSSRQTRNMQGDLSFLIKELGARYATVLHIFRLHTRLKSNQEVDASVLFLISQCRHLSDIRITMHNIFKDGTDCITDITTTRPIKVNVSLNRRKFRHGT